jgi:phospholipase C
VPFLWICAIAAAALALVTVEKGMAQAATPPAQPQAPLRGIHKIRHVIIIMQENRSFDSYFGTFPGADGIPMAGGKPAVCVPDPRSGRCIAVSRPP